MIVFNDNNHYYVRFYLISKHAAREPIPMQQENG
jgi:hypothetical protein